MAGFPAPLGAAGDNPRGGMTDPPAFDATDPVAWNNVNRDQARHRREDAETVRRLMGHKNGRAWMFRLLEECQIRGVPFAPGQPDTTAFALGKQAIGWFLMQAIEAYPEQYMQMLAEARAEEDRVAAQAAAEERRRQRATDAADAMQGFDLPPPKGWEER